MILGFLTIVLGVLAMGAPLVTGLALAMLIGPFSAIDHVKSDRLLGLHNF